MAELVGILIVLALLVTGILRTVWRGRLYAAWRRLTGD